MTTHNYCDNCSDFMLWLAEHYPLTYADHRADYAIETGDPRPADREFADWLKADPDRCRDMQGKASEFAAGLSCLDGCPGCAEW